MTISQGDTVTWTNQDSVPHDVAVTSGPVKFRSPMLTQGKSWSYTFSQAGAYSYTCSVHPDMHGTIAAKPKAAAPAPATDTRTSRRDAGCRADSTAYRDHAVRHPHNPDHHAVYRRPPAAGTAYAATSADPADPSLDPLLLLLGLSTAIVVFCMLHDGSRAPTRSTTEGASDGD